MGMFALCTHLKTTPSCQEKDIYRIHRIHSLFIIHRKKEKNLFPIAFDKWLRSRHFLLLPSCDSGAIFALRRVSTENMSHLSVSQVRGQADLSQSNRTLCACPQEHCCWDRDRWRECKLFAPSCTFFVRFLYVVLVTCRRSPSCMKEVTVPCSSETRPGQRCSLQTAEWRCD